MDPDHTALSILGMTTSYFAAAPILSAIVGHDLLTAPAVETRKRALLDFLDHGLAFGEVKLQMTGRKFALLFLALFSLSPSWSIW